MSLLETLRHLFSFVSPAFVVAALVTLSARVVLAKAGRPPWYAAFGLNFGAGVLVLAAGLWYFGRDGKMATYAALVLAVATTQWVTNRAWRS